MLLFRSAIQRRHPSASIYKVRPLDGTVMMEACTAVPMANENDFCDWVADWLDSLPRDPHITALTPKAFKAFLAAIPTEEFTPKALEPVLTVSDEKMEEFRKEMAAWTPEYRAAFEARWNLPPGGATGKVAAPEGVPVGTATPERKPVCLFPPGT